jgi:hypothetical protein
MPFARSRQERQRRVSQDAIEIPDVLYSQLARIAERKPAREPNAQPADDHLEQGGELARRVNHQLIHALAPISPE